jgi:3-oxoadipate enol-lactonase
MSGHITQMADIEGWCRSRRFELVEPTDSGICKYLALHEFDIPNALGADKAGNVKWRNEVIEIVAERDRTLWIPYHPATQPGIHIVNHGGLQFNVKVDGTPGSPVIALSNPLGQDLSIWDGVVSALKSKYQIVRHDQRGHGRTSQPFGNTSFPQLTDDLVAILDYLKVRKLHALIGVSMGGVVALDFGLRYSKRVGKIIACDCAPLSAPGNKEAWDSRIALIREKGIDALADQTAARWFTDPWKENPANKTTLKKVRDLFAKLPPSAFIANARAMDHYDYLEKMKDLKVPCVLVVGAQDLPLEQMKEMEKRIPDVKMNIIENCGHLPMVEQPREFMKILEGVL